MKYDGGPAFPYTIQGINGEAQACGMTLGDWFAGQALASMAHPEATGDATASAAFAWEVSDAMLAEKAKRESDSQ